MASPHFSRRLLEEATQPPPASVSSTRDKLNGMRRVKRQVGAKETQRQAWCPQRIYKPFYLSHGGHHRAVFGNNQASGLSMETGLFFLWETEYRQHVG